MNADRGDRDAGRVLTPAEVRRLRLPRIALGFAIAALVITFIGSMLLRLVGLFVIFAAVPAYGAMILLALVGLVLGVQALRTARRPAVAVWAISLSALVLLYAAPTFVQALRFFGEKGVTP